MPAWAAKCGNARLLHLNSRTIRPMSQSSFTEARPGVPEPELHPPPPAKGPPRSRRLSLTITVAVAVIVLGVVWWLNHAHSGAAMAGGGAAGRRAFFSPDAAVPVVAQPAQQGDIQVYLTGLGTVTPLANITIRTRISGQLTEVHFQEGQWVQSGDLLAVIDPRPYQVALEQAQGQLLQAQAQLAQARNDLSRYEKLSQQDSIAVQQVDATHALVSQYEGLVKTDQAAIDSAQLNLTYCHITAPVTGRVGLRQVDPGNYVTPGDANGLVTLTEVKPISVVFTLPEEVFSQVAARLHANAQIPIDVYDSSQTHQLASGTLGAIDNQADTSTGTFKLRALFPNDDEVLFPNEFVNVSMLLNVEHGAIVVPTSALERGQQGTYVYVVGPDDTVNARTVTLGPTQGEKVAIATGLKAGEQVVIDGADRLREGGKVLVQQPGQAGARPAAGGPGGAPGSPGGQRRWRNGANGEAAGQRPAGEGGQRPARGGGGGGGGGS